MFVCVLVWQVRKKKVKTQKKKFETKTLKNNYKIRLQLNEEITEYLPVQLKISNCKIFCLLKIHCEKIFLFPFIKKKS